MQKPFSKERTIEENWKINNISKSIPIFMIEPIKKNITKALILIPGLNGNGSMIRFFNYNEFDDCLLFSFDPRAQGNNKNKASRFYKKYVEDIKLLIDEFKVKNPQIKEIFLCGESWGATLAFLTYKKYSKDIKGVIGWNMPYNVVDVAPEKGWNKFIKTLKVFITFLTSINTYDEAPLADALTNNKVVKKVIQMVKNNKLNNKVPIAAWRSFKKSWKVLENNENLNIKYIQSMEDVMLSKKGLSKIQNIKNVIIFEKGYHILTFDDNMSDKLFYEIFNFIL